MGGYSFVVSDDCLPPGSVPIDYELIMRQQPDRGKIFVPHKEKERRPIDPPPIIQLKIKDENEDPCHNYLQSPHIFLCAELLAATDKQEKTPLDAALGGTTVSSLHRLKDIDDSDGGFFVFGDLSVKREGEFRLRFHLFEVRKDIVCCLKSITSGLFKIYTPKQFPGMLDSTFLSRSFSDQGVRIRIRKEHRIQMGKTPRARAIVSPGQQPQYTSPDHQGQPSQTVPRYTAAIPANAYVGRPMPEHHYPAGPDRTHGIRQDYHPYRESYAPQARGYYDRPEMHYPGSPYTMISPGSHAPIEYGAQPNYPRPHHVLSPSGARYYMSPDARPGSLATYPFHDYSERRTKHYAESRLEPPPSQSTQFTSPFPVDPANPHQYIRDPFPPKEYSSVSPLMRYSPSDQIPPPHHYYQQYYESYESPRIRAVGPPPQGYPSQHHHIHGQRGARHNNTAILTEEMKFTSPLHGSSIGSESSSMGQSTPNLRAEPSRRGSLENHSEGARLPPLRNPSNAERQIPREQAQSKSNSNVYELIGPAR